MAFALLKRRKTNRGHETTDNCGQRFSTGINYIDHYNYGAIIVMSRTTP